MSHDPAALVLMYFILPVWLLAGCADWLCHRASHIETTTGAKESAIHLIMFTEMGIPLIAVIFLQVNAGIIAMMIIAFVLHEATALWDTSYAATAREVTPLEQHVHSYLEIIPLAALILAVILHWPQFQALFGFGGEVPRFDLAWKPEPLPTGYVTTVLGVILLFELLPFTEEFVRGMRANRGALIPPKARIASRPLPGSVAR